MTNKNQTNTEDNMKDISFPFKWAGPSESAEHGIDMIITVSEFIVDEYGDVYIEEFEITTDYSVSYSTPHPADEYIKLFDSMLNDGRHLQDKILDQMHVEYEDALFCILAKEWKEYWEEAGRDCGFCFDGDYLI